MDAGAFSGQPITPRDISELKQKLEQEGSKTARQRAAKQQHAKDSSGGGGALPPAPTPAGTSTGGASATAATGAGNAAAAQASSSGGAAAAQPQQQAMLQVTPEEPADGGEDDVDMLQVRARRGSAALQGWLLWGAEHPHRLYAYDTCMRVSLVVSALARWYDASGCPTAKSKPCDHLPLCLCQLAPHPLPPARPTLSAVGYPLLFHFLVPCCLSGFI